MILKPMHAFQYTGPSRLGKEEMTMFSIAFAPSLEMTTTELEPTPRRPRAAIDARPTDAPRVLRMSWVVVTGQSRNRKLQMRWMPSAEKSADGDSRNILFICRAYARYNRATTSV
jgi:hypothetical protein